MLADLSAVQIEAATYAPKPLLIIAGAGAGKTRVITHRVAHLLERDESILAVTFTNKAAKEMMERVFKLVGPSSRVWVGTFHSTCARLLRIYGAYVGITQDFSIYDDDDSKKLMEAVFETLGVKNMEVKAVLAEIERAKHRFVSPKEYIKGAPDSPIGRLYEVYEQRLEKSNAVDFGGLICKVLELCQQSPVADQLRNKFQHILVDEWQDTDHSQYMLVKLLGATNSVTVVGDDGQCIPEGQLVNTPNGKKPIETIKAGDSVFTLYDKGIRSERVVAVQQSVHDSYFRFKTKSGREFCCTGNHIVFARTPGESDYYYNYLAWRPDMGWRIGLSKNGLGTYRKPQYKARTPNRLNQEGAERLWVIDCHDNLSSALLHEKIYSLKYQIPTYTFVDHTSGGQRKRENGQGRIASLNKEDRYKLFAAFPNSGWRLLGDKEISFTKPVLLPKASGSKNRVSINIRIAGFRGSTEVSIESQKLPKAFRERYNARLYKANTDVFRIKSIFKKYQDALLFVRELENNLGDDALSVIVCEEIVISYGTSKFSFLSINASQLFPGMHVVSSDGSEISDDVIVSREKIEKETVCYDLTLNTANFFVEGVCVHNSIYSFRHADIRNILQFQKDYSDAKVIKLERNYRSTGHILNLANSLIANNKQRIPKNLYTELGEGQKATLFEARSSDNESAFIGNAIEKFLRAGWHAKDIAVLYRTNAQSRGLEEAFRLRSIRYNIVGGVRFYERAEIKNIMAYLRCLVNPKDDVSLSRIINVPARGFGKAMLVALNSLRDSLGVSLYHTLKVASGEDSPFTESVKNKISSFLELHTSVTDKLFLSPSEVIRLVFSDFGYEALLIEANETDRIENVFEFIGDAKMYEATEGATLGGFLEKVALATSSDTEPTAGAISMMTIHACVHPDTLVETYEGLVPIKYIADKGMIATPDGAAFYNNKSTFPKRKAFKVTTSSGYSLIMSPEHGITTCNKANFSRCEAKDLKIGDLLRLRLGLTIDVKNNPKTPDQPTAPDVRAKLYHLPHNITEDLAELLGLIVADGTIFHGGYRLIKRYHSVVDRFAELNKGIFGCEVTKYLAKGRTPAAEVDSVFLAKWLLSFGGTAPKKKDVPDIILRSPLKIQAAFLRGLFEDGTVNEENGHIDHIHWENRTKSVVESVQKMLLRFGIISAVREHEHFYQDVKKNRKITSLYIYSQSAILFRDLIGFVSTEKNDRLKGSYADELQYRAPISRTEIEDINEYLAQSEKCNARNRGYLSRGKIKEIINRLPVEKAEFLKDRIQWHYERIKIIEEIKCETMCVSVPKIERFLQNGFDGWNSKGLEFPVVFVAGLEEELLPHYLSIKEGNVEEERRLMYVAVTRAERHLYMTYARERYLFGKQVHFSPSRFLRELPVESINHMIDGL